MSKQIMIPDDLYNKIKSDADNNCRTLGGQIEYYLKNLPTLEKEPTPVAPEINVTKTEVKQDWQEVGVGFPCCHLKSPCKHWHYDSNLERWENSLTGEIKEIA